MLGETYGISFSDTSYLVKPTLFYPAPSPVQSSLSDFRLSALSSTCCFNPQAAEGNGCSLFQSDDHRWLIFLSFRCGLTTQNSSQEFLFYLKLFVICSCASLTALTRTYKVYVETYSFSKMFTLQCIWEGKISAFWKLFIAFIRI